ncbi:hypothetical protein GCM10023189_16020 [Nibrella saemangeumensis]|uniref:DUF11 domain-containing protein n=1 Tax=Nibrella saemangeumensis TaxID=1084526 RepID=A0ABP8MLY9_9BACT
MKRILLVFFWVMIGLTSRWGHSQQISTNTVNYQVTYNPATDRYTALVIPNYNLPNGNNTTTTERGGTAQFTLKVPAQFVIQDIQDIRGTWEKNPLKLGPGQPNQNYAGAGLDPAFNYYVIGKSPSETEYGNLQSGVAVALFSFRGNGCFGPIAPLPPNDPFIAAADQRFSLNVGNSFYSRSGQPAGGNVVPLEQFVNIAGPAANCQTGTVANPDNATTQAGTPVTTTVLANDTRNGGPASTTNVTVSLTGPPASGTAVVNANGSITFTPAAGFTGPVSYTYTICSLTQPPQCASAVVSVTVLPVAAQPADLVVTKLVSRAQAAVGDVVSFTVTVQNVGPGNAMNVVVLDTLPRSAQVQVQGAAVVSRGSYNPGTGLWSIGNLNTGETVSMVLSVRLLAEGVVVNQASIQSSGASDPNLNNNVASACTSVPIVLCEGESLLVSIPGNYQNIQWFRNGQPIAGSTARSITITQAGNYTVSASNNTCPAGGCCPIIVTAGDCCVPVCTPVVLTKTKSGGLR